MGDEDDEPFPDEAGFGDDFQDSDEDEEDEEGEEGEQKGGKDGKGGEGGRPAPHPPSFSRVDFTLPADELRARFPQLRRAHETRCELRAGDLLYMPCGWFHDVTSHGEHRALNYWFHPPDRPSFAAPYSAPRFWEAEWRAASKHMRTA